MFVHPVNVLYVFLEQTLKPFSDSDYQKRIWIEQQGPEVSDYDEATMHFMERCDDMFNRPYDFEGLDEPIQKALKDFYNEVCEFDFKIASQFPEGQDEQVLNEPKWIEIQKKAEQTYKFIISRLKEKKYENRNNF